MAFTKAVRKSVPGLLEMAGVSSSGKTFSALLVAAGMATTKGRVGFLDAENGRGNMYADDPIIMKALPDGYEYDELAAPFTPDRYIEKMREAEKAGITVLITDTLSHEWEGIGGCTEIAEKNKLGNLENWGLAKRHHKRLVYHCLSSPLQQIFCLRAREKVKIIGGKVIPKGIEPVCEKNWSFEMTFRWAFDEATHFANCVKGPSVVKSSATGRLLTPEDGATIRRWIEGGSAVNPYELLQKRARAAAEDGMETYGAFFSDLSTAEKKTLADSSHSENKRIAEKADEERKALEEQDAPVTEPFAAFIAFEKRDSARFWRVMGGLGYGELKDIPANARETTLQLVAKEFEQAKAA